jgi:predicted nucleic acid-binding protein
VQSVLRGLAIAEVSLPPDAAPRLATLRAQTNLKLPDCCVLLAAEDSGADTVLTFDAQLAAAARAAGFATP